LRHWNKGMALVRSVIGPLEAKLRLACLVPRLPSVANAACCWPARRARLSWRP
jgi:hypothetical protein